MFVLRLLHEGRACPVHTELIEKSLMIKRTLSGHAPCPIRTGILPSLHPFLFRIRKKIKNIPIRTGISEIPAVVAVIVGSAMDSD